MDNPIPEGTIGAWIMGGVAMLISAYRWISGIIRDAKNSTTVDAKQNEQLVELRGEINILKNDVSNIKSMQKESDNKTSKELEKIDIKVDKMTELIMKLLKG